MKLFVYGTLLTGYGNWAWALAPQEGVKDSVIGFEMFHLGGFPGIVQSSEDDVVFGEVFNITEQQLNRIDRLEGYSPSGGISNLYNRIEVVTESGETAYTYVYNGNVSGAKRVHSGSWLDK